MIIIMIIITIIMIIAKFPTRAHLRPAKTQNAQDDQSLRFPTEDTLDPTLPTECGCAG